MPRRPSWKESGGKGKDQTHADAVLVRLVHVTEVDGQAGAAFGAEELVLVLGVEAVDGTAVAAVVVPLDLRCGRVWGSTRS